MAENSYNLETVYDTEIAPLMDTIIAACEAHGLPMIASFAFANDDDDTAYCMSLVPRGESQWLPPEFLAARDALYARRPSLFGITIGPSKGA